jgi:hypothetical protein
MPQMARHISTGIVLLISKTEPPTRNYNRIGGSLIYKAKFLSMKSFCIFDNIVLAGCSVYILLRPTIDLSNIRNVRI